MMANTISTIMTTTTTTLRIREGTFQDVFEQMSHWPLTVGTLGRAYFQDNKERLMSLDAKCFQELHALLDVPEDSFYVMYLGAPDSRNPDGYFYAKFYALGYPILAAAEKIKDEQKRQSYARILREGQMQNWIELLNTANAALNVRVAAGIEDSDEHHELELMMNVWDEWKAETK